MTESQQNKMPVFVGLTADDSAYQACVVRGHGDEVSILKNYIVSKAETNWVDFITMIGQDFESRNCVNVTVFADRCVGFYRIDVPPVSDNQIASVVASQAEIHLPLPVEQMLYDWRTPGKNRKKTTVSIAAAKKEMLANAISPARQAQADFIVLYSEAVLNAVQFLCEKPSEDFSLLYLNSEGAKLLFVENDMLTKAVTFDCDLPSANESLSEALLLCQDVQNSITDYAPDEPLPLFLYFDVDDSICKVVESVLKRRGIEAGRLTCRRPDCSIPALGAALIAADERPHYDLFRNLYSCSNSEIEKGSSGKSIVLGIAACVLLVILIAVGYGADKYRLAEYNKQMNTPEFKQLQETHDLRTLIAQQRIDIPGLIEKINLSVPKGVTISSLTVQRGQPVVVGGFCKDPKLMYEFEEAMAKHNGVRTVRVTSRGVDEKKKQTAFTLTFDYKTFTQKRKI